MTMNYLRKTICSIAAAGFLLGGCISPNGHDDEHLAKKTAASCLASYSTRAGAEKQDAQVSAPTILAKKALGDKQPLLSLDNKALIEATRLPILPLSYNPAQYNLNSGALAHDMQLVLAPTDGISMYFNNGENSGKSKTRKIATQELLKRFELARISVMLPRELSVYNGFKANAGFRFGIPSIRELVQAFAGSSGEKREKWNDVLSEFKIVGYLNYGNLSIGVGALPQYKPFEERIGIDTPVNLEYRINF